MRYPLAALLVLGGCAHRPPLVPEFHGGVAIYKADRSRIRYVCDALYGMPSDGCFLPEVFALFVEGEPDLVSNKSNGDMK